MIIDPNDLLLLVPFFFFLLAFRRHLPSLRLRRGLALRNSSILLSHYTDGAQLTPVSKGKVGAYDYSAIVTTHGSALIFWVNLDFTSQLHLLGVPNSSGTKQLNPTVASSVMERVELEGDYQNYFTLYCEKGQQVQSRYILDPKAMAFTVDFCRSHNWEIINNNLYFVQEGSDHPDDPTAMFADIATFIDEIRPAVAAAPHR